MCEFCEQGYPKTGAWHKGVRIEGFDEPCNVLCQDNLKVTVVAQQSVYPTSACCRAEIIPGIRQGEPNLCSVCGGTCR